MIVKPAGSSVPSELHPDGHDSNACSSGLRIVVKTCTGVLAPSCARIVHCVNSGAAGTGIAVTACVIPSVGAVITGGTGSGCGTPLSSEWIAIDCGTLPGTASAMCTLPTAPAISHAV